MNILVLHSSPRKNGNTSALVNIFIKEAERLGHSVKALYLYDLKINPCSACRECQKNWAETACVQNDDMNLVFDEVEKADLIILASPIYSFFCTPPLKAALDRMVYAFNKYYGDKWGPSLWRGKKMAIITTCGYAVEKGTDLWEEGIKRYCKHSELVYVDMLAKRHKSYKEEFLTPEIEAETISFTRDIIENV